ncbi:MAG: Flp pilus assembly protein CpaB, partial [Chloroflexota bacterium]|nr:Flp pilus assembly protein CpaB [Chloroflexota bacterium]
MGRLRGFLWLVAGLVVAILAGIVAFVVLSRSVAESEEGAVAAKPMTEVVIAARAIPLRTALTEEDLATTEMAVDAVPDGAVAEMEDAVGKVTLVDLYAGEVILAQRLLDPNVITANGRHALLLSEDEVLMAYPAEDLMSRISVLKPGDRVDILISLELPVEGGLIAPAETTEGTATTTAEEEELVTFVVLENVGIAALPGQTVVRQEAEEGGPLPSGGTSEEGGRAKALLLTLAEQDALILKY